MRSARNARTRFRPVASLACGLALSSCAHDTRFALQGPVTREDDRHPLAHTPAHASDLNSPYSVDNIAFRPLSRVLLLERGHEARDVNALDEVADSTWFTARRPSPARAAEGACAAVAPPVFPLTITSSKIGGATPGFFVRDATGRRYALKFDQYPQPFPHGQPELNTAADAVVSRLYWTLGYNTSCNDIAFVPPEALTLGSHAWHTDAQGQRQPLTRAVVDDALMHHGYRVGHAYRFGLSLFVSGQPLGPWSAEGRRDDDANDTIAHEDRRVLRGERLLAAWVNHWDARAPNSLDSYVTDGGYVLHYAFDFGDSLGAWSDDLLRSDRQGFTYSVHPSVIFEDILSFGAIRRPWDAAAADPVVPYLGVNFDVAHFDPGGWVAALPSPRFAAASPQDMAWMARRIAGIDRAHLEAMMTAGHFSSPRVPARMVDILMGRRERLLAWSFARVSPLTDVRPAGDRAFCATDLGLATGVSEASHTAFGAVSWRGGVDPTPDRAVLDVQRGDAPGDVCFTLPAHLDDARIPDDGAPRYVVAEITREAAQRRTRLRAHFYDLGSQRGYVLVGLERP